MLGDGEVPVAPVDQLASVIAYQRADARKGGQPMSMIIYGNGEKRKASSRSRNRAIKRAHFDGGLANLFGVILDALIIGARVRVLAAMPVRISAHKRVVELVMRLASETVFVQALGKPVGELLDNEEARGPENTKATVARNESLEALRKKVLSGDELQYSSEMHDIYSKKFKDKDGNRGRSKEARKVGRIL